MRNGNWMIDYGEPPIVGSVAKFGRTYWTGPYVNDKKEGTWTIVNGIGKSTAVGLFVNGKKEGVWKDSGRQGCTLRTYVNGKYISSADC